MLIPAILRKDDILKEFRKMQYTDELMYWVGSLDNYMPNIQEEPSKEVYQFAIVGKDDKLVGYISYHIDWYSSQAKNFSLMSFDKGNALVGRELHNVITNLVENIKLHRVEWYMIGGNPVERSYDRICNRYGGRKIVLRDVIRDRYGRYRDSITYEIITGGN